MGTFFWVSSHNAASPLPSVLDEFDAIAKSLRPLIERLILKLVFKLKADHASMIEEFSDLSGLIEIFHFSGHANGHRLDILGGGHIQGLARWFGLKNNAEGKSPPRLVFLNGCATKDQVAVLHQYGVTGVIATNYKVDDQEAYVFAKTFYNEWVKEGVTFIQALNFAEGALKGVPRYADQAFSRDTGDSLGLNSDQATWGFFPNPSLDAEALQQYHNWALNPIVELPLVILDNYSPLSRDSIRKLAFKYMKYAKEQKRKIDERAPLFDLIRDLPWVVGTHLRRLFALAEGMSEPQNNLARLKDIDGAYTDFLRFLYNILVSMLWDLQKELKVLPKEQLPFPVVDAEEAPKVDYLNNIRLYLKVLRGIEGDVLELEAHMQQFLETIDGDSQLIDGHKLMAELHLALNDPDPKRLKDFLANRNQDLDNVQELCQKAEATYVSFLEQAFFLSNYRLLSIWSISVDRVRFIETTEPYMYKTIDLHGAFGNLKFSNTAEQSHGDSYCIALALRRSEHPDSLRNILNLSPFYIDKNAFLSKSEKGAHPSIFAFQYQLDGDRFLFSNIDRDRSFTYQNTANQEMVIDEAGAVFSKALDIGEAESRNFEVIYSQLKRLNKDFKGS